MKNILLVDLNHTMYEDDSLTMHPAIVIMGGDASPVTAIRSKHIDHTIDWHTETNVRRYKEDEAVDVLLHESSGWEGAVGYVELPDRILAEEWDW